MEYDYIGNELELFSEAYNWKSYFSKLIRPYLQGNVLEVGAGIGGTTKVLYDSEKADRWTCLEPDPALCKILEDEIQNKSLPDCCEVIKGTVNDLSKGSIFDSITYIDVLEHIENDAQEINTVIQHLEPSGYLIILSPSYQFLYSNFDKELGHFRRYNKTTLTRVIPSSLGLVSLKYLDSISVLTNLINRLILKQNIPTSNQIRIWDKTLVPVSKAIDPLLRYCFGKSILGVWQKS